MVGLSSPQFLDHLESNSGVYLYCSVITARFLQASIRHRPLSPYLRPLTHDEPAKITIPTVANEPHHILTVTLIPAGHCPGSVMLVQMSICVLRYICSTKEVIVTVMNLESSKAIGLDGATCAHLRHLKPHGICFFCEYLQPLHWIEYHFLSLSRNV